MKVRVAVEATAIGVDNFGTEDWKAVENERDHEALLGWVRERTIQ